MTVKAARMKVSEHSGCRWKRPPKRNLDEETVTVIPDKQTYTGGDVAKLLVNSPFFPAQVLMTYARQGVLKTTQFKMESASQTVEIPIDEALTPGFVVRFDLVGSSPRLNSRGQPDPNLPPRPAFARPYSNQDCPDVEDAQSRSPTRGQKLSPGTETTVTVKVSDALASMWRG